MVRVRLDWTVAVPPRWFGDPAAAPQSLIADVKQSLDVPRHVMSNSNV